MPKIRNYEYKIDDVLVKVPVTYSNRVRRFVIVIPIVMQDVVGVYEDIYGETEEEVVSKFNEYYKEYNKSTKVERKVIVYRFYVTGWCWCRVGGGRTGNRTHAVDELNASDMICFEFDYSVLNEVKMGGRCVYYTMDNKRCENVCSSEYKVIEWSSDIEDVFKNIKSSMAQLVSMLGDFLFGNEADIIAIVKYKTGLVSMINDFNAYKCRLVEGA